MAPAVATLAAVTDPAPATPVAAAGALPVDPSARCGVARARAPATLDLYKHDLACRIHARNVGQIYQGAPPPVLRSVVVLTFRVDSKGRPVQIAVRRSNGIRDLERRAIQSVRLASPLPVPSAAMLKRGSTEITETWLFRDDGRFQVRTLALVQAKSGY
jgi:protein TonB